MFGALISAINPVLVLAIFQVLNSFVLHIMKHLIILWREFQNSFDYHKRKIVMEKPLENFYVRTHVNACDNPNNPQQLSPFRINSLKSGYLVKKFCPFYKIYWFQVLQQVFLGKPIEDPEVCYKVGLLKRGVWIVSSQLWAAITSYQGCQLLSKGSRNWGFSFGGFPKTRDQIEAIPTMENQEETFMLTWNHCIKLGIIYKWLWALSQIGWLLSLKGMLQTLRLYLLTFWHYLINVKLTCNFYYFHSISNVSCLGIHTFP